MRLMLLNTKLDFDASKMLFGHTFHLDGKLFTSNYNNYRYRGNYWDKVVTKRLLSDVMTDDISPLTVEVKRVELEPVGNIHIPVLHMIEMSSTPLDGNIFKSLMDQFGERLQVTVRIKSPSGFQLFKNEEWFMENNPPKQFIWIGGCRMGLTSEKEDQFIAQGMGMAHMSISVDIPARLISPTAYLDFICKPKPGKIPGPFLRMWMAEGSDGIPGEWRPLLGGMIFYARNLEEIKCPKLVLYDECPSDLKTILEDGMKTGQVDMTDMSENAVTAFVNYIIDWDLKLPRKDLGVAVELLCAAQKYDIPHLEAHMVKTLMYRKSKYFAMETAFKVYLRVKDILSAIPLRLKIAHIFKSKFQELEELQEYKELSRNDAELVQLISKDIACV